MVQFEDILRKVQGYRPADDLGLVRKAYELSASEHRAQKRLSGDPFLSHPLEEANILADMRLDPICLPAGLLHAVVEDTPTSLDRIRQQPCPELAGISSGVRKSSRLQALAR